MQRRRTLRDGLIGFVLIGTTLTGFPPSTALARARSTLLPSIATTGQPPLWDQLPANASLARQFQLADETSRLIKQQMAVLRERIEAARQARDIVLLSCLNETLSGATPWAVVADTALVLAWRSTESDPEQTRYELRRVAIGQSNALKVLERAERCQGNAPENTEEVRIDAGYHYPGYSVDSPLADPFAPFYPEPGEPPPFSP